MKSSSSSIPYLMSVVFIAMSASFLPPFSDFISISANNVWPYPGPDIHFDFFVGALMGLLCGIVLVLTPIAPRDRPIVIACWATKLAVALFILPFYEYAYGIDIDGYFFFSDLPWKPLTASGGGLGTWHVRVLAWMLFKVIGPSYHGGKVVFSFIGFIGIYLTYRGAVKFFRQDMPTLLLLTSLSPTCLFWSATLGKDPIILFAIGLYSYGCLCLFVDFKTRHITQVAAGIFLASLIRNYFLPIMAIPLAIAYLTQTRRPIIRLLALPLIVSGIVYSFSQFAQRMGVDSFETFTTYQSKVSSGWQGGSSFVLPMVNSPIMLLLVAPLAIFTALFRPTLLEAHNVFSFAAAIDNTFLLILFSYAWSRSRFREFFQTGILWMTAFILIWSVMYGIGTGNLGAISRFKIQVLPIFITLLLYMARKRASIRPSAS